MATRHRHPHLARRLAALLTLSAAAALTLLACEHAHHWRSAEPWPADFTRKMSDPAAAHEELVRRMAPPAPKAQEDDAAAAKSAGCISCHGQTDEPDMHPGRSLAIGCADCHGGDAKITSNLKQPGRPTRAADEPEYFARMKQAHVQPRNPQAWLEADLLDGRPFGQHAGEDSKSETPPRHRARADTFALLNAESPEFVRFINPGDLRVADFACGACHAKEVAAVRHGMMSHGAMLWGAALYNNGGVPNKLPRFGESYSPFGQPQRLQGIVEIDEAKWNKQTLRIDAPVRWPTAVEMDRQGVLPLTDPLAAWNISQPGNILRVFERGTKLPVPGGATPNAPPSEIALPNPLAENGRPDKGLSVRGLGTLNRTDPVFLGLQKTRLLDPTLNFMGTNDHPGDFRASGCSACHSPYANDRDPFHSDKLAAFGNRGHSFSNDPTIPKDQPGHPIKHAFTNAIPNSQCVVCHIHPGTSYANTYLGYMWWDNESDGEFMYPRQSHRPTDEQEWKALRKNPDAAQLKGLWGNLYPGAVSHAGHAAGEDFLEESGKPRTGGAPPQAAALKKSEPALNDQLKHNQFADFHGHGWIFRAVFKKDLQGRLVDRQGNLIDPNDPDKWAKAVHLRDIHLEKGMQCVDCHFAQDAHGNGKLYGEARNAIEITCVDCHGSYDRRANLHTTGPAAPADKSGTDLAKDWVGLGKERKRRFEWRGDQLIQRSAMDPKVEWTVVQTLDTINPASAWAQAHPDSARASRYAKTIRTDGKTWGDLPAEGKSLSLAHPITKLECYTCHTSWMTSCFGCHLPMRANQRTPMLHNESLYTRNFTQYNFQVLRDDVFMLGRDGTVKGGRIVPVRSSSAVVVSSQNANREWIYHQQQTVSGEGYSGQAFNPHFPHATSGAGTTRQCADCHLAQDNSNNAWMAQLLLQGTGFVNFFGRYVYVAEGSHGLEGVAVTEHDEPQAVYGSQLHALAYPDELAAMARIPFSAAARHGDAPQAAALNRENAPVLLPEAYHHDAPLDCEILDLQFRGEYLYAARGKAGFYVYDIANIDNKGFSERIVTAPVSPLGQQLGFKTTNCVAIASPATVAVDPARARLSSDPAKPYANVMAAAEPWHINQEQRVHPLYAFLYLADAQEGLILTLAATLLDGDPQNNFLERAKLADGSTAFNPGGILDGMTHLTLAGHYVYATAAAGLVVIDIDNPLVPKVVATVALRRPKAVAVQFRYALVTDEQGLQVIDITDPTRPRLVESAAVPLPETHRLYLARTWALVACGSHGLAIIDISNPEKPKLAQMYTAGGQLNDCRDVKVGMTNASLFAYVADGKNGLRVLELMGPHTTDQFRGFAPPLAPRLIATHPTSGPALAVGRGLDRDRAVDESGNQVAVFGRWGARPLNLAEMQRMYLRDGKIWTVTNSPASEPLPFSAAAGATTQPSPPTGSTPRPGPRRPGAR